MFKAPEPDVAIRDMRARFLSVSDEIARELGSLARSIANAPGDVRAAVLAAAEQIASTQQRLVAAANRLPASPEQRLAIMQSVLQRQQGALRQLAGIIRQYPPSRPQAPTAAGRVDAAPGFAAAVGPASASRSGMEPVPRGDGASLQSGGAYGSAAAAQAALFHPVASGQGGQADVSASEELIHGEAPGHPVDPGEQSHGDELDDEPMADDAAPDPQDGRASGSHARSLRERVRGLAHATVDSAGARRSALIGVVLAAFLLGYLMIPRASEWVDTDAANLETAKRTGRVGALTTGVSPGRPGLPIRLEQPTPPTPPAIVRIEAQELPAAASTPLPDSNGHADRPRVVAPTPVGPAPSPPAPVLPPQQAVSPRERVASKQDRAALETGSTETAGEARNERFVPVVFTHKDQATAMRTFADLQRQYPALLTHRTGEAQPVDLGNKGVWHRLVVLPPGPRPQAKKLCDAFMAAGYDRCWVKAY